MGVKILTVGEELTNESNFEIIGKTILKIIFTLFLFLGIYSAAFEGYDGTVLGNTDFIIHELGHGLFRIFSFVSIFSPKTAEFLVVIGGSATQILLPFIIGLYFILTKRVYSALFCLYWVGENLINNSVYVGDARCECLTLWPPNAEHDWNYLLTQLNLLQFDKYIANIERNLGIVFVLCAIGLMIVDILFNLSKLIRNNNIKFR